MIPWLHYKYRNRDRNPVRFDFDFDDIKSAMELSNSASPPALPTIFLDIINNNLPASNHESRGTNISHHYFYIAT